MTFGIIFTIAGRFFSEGNFSQKLGLCHAKPNKVSNTIASFRKSCQFQEKLQMDGLPATCGGPKSKKKVLSSVLKILLENN